MSPPPAPREQPGIHVAGASTASHAVLAPSFAVRVLCWLSDLSLLLALALGGIALRSSLLDSGKRGVFMICGGGALAWIIQKLLLGRTWGERIWSLRARPGPWGALQYDDRPDPRSRLVAIFLTLATFSALAASFELSISREPLFMSAETILLEPFFPSAQETGNWAIIPFFYGLGAWPKTFLGKPIFYTIPYEKGPPSRFIGHIIARWQMPGVQAVFEGPLTVGDNSRGEIKDCFIEGLSDWSCLKIKDRALSRHLAEMRALGLKHWRLSWFANHAASQGILLRASSDQGSQDRYIFITPQGTQQAFILNLSRSDSSAEEARALFQKAIRSLRVSDDLGLGRAWIDQQLSAQKVPSRALGIGQLSELQALLISKLSVDPKTIAVYYHLAGNALLLGKYAASHPDLQKDNDWAALARPLIANIHRFAQDVAPQSAETQEIQSIWIESEKF